MLFEKLSSDKCVLQLFKGKKLIKTLKQRDFFQKTIFYKKKTTYKMSVIKNILFEFGVISRVLKYIIWVYEPKGLKPKIQRVPPSNWSRVHGLTKHLSASPPLFINRIQNHSLKYTRIHFIEFSDIFLKSITDFRRILNFHNRLVLNYSKHIVRF